MSTVEQEPQLRNPLLEEKGLSIGHSTKAFNSRQNYIDAVHEDYDTRNSWRKYHDQLNTALTPGGIVVEAAQKVLTRRKIRQTLKQARSHYKNHEAEYQVQAVKDAADEGVHTSFGEK
jgi:hypothetical protein